MAKSSSAEDLAPAIAYLKTMKVYSASAASSPPTRFIDMANRPFEALAPFDTDFYVSLARMVAEEPVKERDLTIMGQLHSLGIGKDATFEPGATTNAILKRAIAEAHAYLMEGFRKDGFLWYPHRRWRFPASDDMLKSQATAILKDRVLVDDRAFVFFGAFGGTRNPPPNLYLKTFEDAQGKALNGSNTYRLRIPANVPTSRSWAVIAYDSQTAGFIRQAPVVGIDSFNSNLVPNADGSVDLYFAPKAPKGQEANWISTAKGRPFFLVFRNYAPDKSVLERKSSWVLNDVERAN
jgi:hypothetical protein